MALFCGSGVAIAVIGLEGGGNDLALGLLQGGWTFPNNNDVPSGAKWDNV